MRQFALIEMEVDESSWDAEVLTEFAYNIAHYLVQSGPVIENGDAVGASNEQRIVVEYG
jgi:hypothetical protein